MEQEIGVASRVAAAQRAMAGIRARTHELYGLVAEIDACGDAVADALLDSERALDPATARRLACDAGVVPVVLGGRGEPLDVGRLSYTVPAGMRRALARRDGGCSFPGCTRRPKRCHAHHLEHWADGGETRLGNLAVLCRSHHHVVHHGGWSVAMVDGRPWYRPPAWLDPTRTPRPGGCFPVQDAG